MDRGLDFVRGVVPVIVFVLVCGGLFATAGALLDLDACGADIGVDGTDLIGFSSRII